MIYLDQQKCFCLTGKLEKRIIASLSFTLCPQNIVHISFWIFFFAGLPEVYPPEIWKVVDEIQTPNELTSSFCTKFLRPAQMYAQFVKHTWHLSKSDALFCFILYPASNFDTRAGVITTGSENMR